MRHDLVHYKKIYILRLKGNAEDKKLKYSVSTVYSIVI